MKGQNKNLIIINKAQISDLLEVFLRQSWDVPHDQKWVWLHSGKPVSREISVWWKDKGCGNVGAVGDLERCSPVGKVVVVMVSWYWNVCNSSFCSLFITLFCPTEAVLMLQLVVLALFGFTAFNSFLGKAPSQVAYLTLFRWIHWAFSLDLFH